MNYIATYIIKIEFRYLASFLARWNEALRPIKVLEINGNTADPRLVGIKVRILGNDFEGASWLANEAKEQGFVIFNEKGEKVC